MHSKFFMAAGLAVVLAAPTARAGTQFDAIKARGELVCGTRGDTLGFARRDDKGKYSGLEIDMCRAVAAAIFGNADKIKVTPLEPDKRFPALRDGTVDVLASGTTYTLTRDTAMGLDFVATYYFDTQAFLVPRKLGKKSVRDMNGATVCVQTGTTTTDNLAEYFRNNNMTYKPVLFNALDEARQALFSGRCDIFTADRSAIYAARAGYASNPNDYLILPESASREPLGLVVKAGDGALADIVRWSFYAMVAAEEFGITSRNADEMARSENMSIKRILGGVPGIGKALGVDDKWAYNVLKQVGNYGESYDRNVGSGSSLGIPRSLNSLASQGGMQFAPPIR